MTLKGRALLLTMVVTAALAASLSQAANITWTSPQNITADTNVSTNGTLVRAANLTQNGGSLDANVTLNGVTFARSPYVAATTNLANGDSLVTSDSSAIGAYQGFGGNTAPFSALSTNYKNLLSSGHFNDGTLATAATTARTTLTLKSLTVGQNYEFQVWVNDYRVVNLGQSNPGLVTVISDGVNTVTLEHNVNNALGGIGQFVTGTFTADATTKTITFTGGNTGSDTSPPNCTAILNAYQLRNIGGTVPVAPAITTQPHSQTVNLGGNVTFSVAASGTAPLSYQWKKDSADISGATGSSYTITNVQTSHAGGYSVAVTNSAGSATSNAASLTVQPAPVAPTITTEPASQSVNAGDNVAFSVTVTGTSPLSYQWRKDGANIAGATSSSYALTNVQTSHAGGYSVAVTNSAGSATSNTATLTVTTTTVPAAPSGLSATAVSNSQINLAWTDNSNNEANFVIDRATDSAFSPGS